MMTIRPVFDPAVPVEVRASLLAHGEQLRPGPAAPPGWGRQAAGDAVQAVGLGALCALLPVVLAFTRMFGRACRTVAVAAQAALAAVWFAGDLSGGGFWPGIIVSGAVQLVCTVAAFVLMDAWQLRRGMRRARGGYLAADDFAPESRVMLARAQAAIDAVNSSAAAVAGLLDDAANDVVLSRQEWEIAQALVRRPGRGSGNPGLVARRVEALERYAEQVREADAALAERHLTLGLGAACRRSRPRWPRLTTWLRPLGGSATPSGPPQKAQGTPAAPSGPARRRRRIPVPRLRIRGHEMGDEEGGRPMTERGLSPALSRLPRWVTVLGLVLVLGELAGAALLAKGPGSLGIGAHGGMRTVVLRVDHVPVPGIPCSPYCSQEVDYSTPTGSGTYNAMDDRLRALPFAKTVRVRAGAIVTLDGSYVGDQSITCSITVNGKVVSRNTDNVSSSNGPVAHCQSVIP